MPVKSVGHLVRTRLGIETTKTRGVYVIPTSEKGKVQALASRYGLTPEQVTARPD